MLPVIAFHLYRIALLALYASEFLQTKVAGSFQGLGSLLMVYGIVRVATILVVNKAALMRTLVKVLPRNRRRLAHGQPEVVLSAV